MSELKSERCVNLFRKTGEKGHVGKDLRKIPKGILQKFPELNENSKICCACRKKAYCLQNDSDQQTSNNSNVDTSINEHYDVSSDVEMNVSTDSSASPERKLRSEREVDLEKMLDELKVKFNSLQHNDPLKLRILTIAPSSWSVRKIAREFNSSRRLAQKSKNLKSINGILGETVVKRGKNLPQETVRKVEEFYNDDMNSRMMPSIKDIVSIKNEAGVRESKQKRLLLLNLKELYASFKNIYPKEEISFSKFAFLRPRYCILPGASGTHTVCVCTIHQNVKLMLDAVNIKKLTQNTDTPLKDYKDCIDKMICHKPSSDCNVDKCTKCPGTLKIIQLLRQQLEDSCISHIKCSLWTATDRATLVTQLLSVDDFLSELDNRLQTLKVHSFIAKQQSMFIKEKKESLSANEALVMFDFSENYAYVCQDASQAFHFNNNQCTVVPVIFYYKDDDKLTHQSMIFLSESLKHDTAAVYAIQTLLIPEIKKKVRKLKKIYYVTDGAKQHFKNKYQIANVIHHKEDFHVEAEWHYTATAHGKSMYDGIGATFKRAAYLASLTAKPTEAILTPEVLYGWASSHFKTMRVLYFDKVFHDKIRRKLNARFANCESVPEISKNHGFVVNKNKEVLIKRYSNDRNVFLWSPFK